jgi:hypothetical protein
MKGRVGQLREVDMLPRCVKTHKIMSPDEAGAVAHIRQLQRVGKGNPDYEPYRCEACGSWHVGHSRRAFEKRIRKATRVGSAKARGSGRKGSRRR